MEQRQTSNEASKDGASRKGEAMKTYYELKQEHSKELNDFDGIFFAFNNDQFKTGMEKIGLTIEDTGKIYSIGGGGYILKDRMQAWKDMFKQNSEEMQTMKQDNEFLLDALAYELNNHEYSYTYDMSDALDALELKKEDIDPAILKRALEVATMEVA